MPERTLLDPLEGRSTHPQRLDLSGRYSLILVFLRLDVFRLVRDNECMRRSSKPLPKDPNKLACEVMKLSTEEAEPKAQRSPISEYLSQIGRKGGLKGGKERARKLNPEKRSEIARKAANARWSTKARY